MKRTEKVVRVFFMLVFFAISFQFQAQVEVVPLEESETILYFDTIPQGIQLEAAERKVPDSVIQKLRNDEAFWYANAPIPKKEAAKERNTVSFNWLKEAWVRTALWFLIIGLFAAVLFWYLSALNIRLFRKPSTVIESTLPTTVAEDIFSINYDAEIGKAVKTSNYRQAIRLYYLQALSKLSNKGLIHYQQDHTNSVYVMQLYNTPLYKDFFNLTRSFEYTWYGKFEMTTPVFGILQKDFETFYRQLPA